MAKYLNSDETDHVYPFEQLIMDDDQQVKQRDELRGFRLTKQIIDQNNQIKQLKQQLEYDEMTLSDHKNLEYNRVSQLKQLLQRHFPHKYCEEFMKYDDVYLNLVEAINQLQLQAEFNGKHENIVNNFHKFSDNFSDYKTTKQQNDILYQQVEICKKQLDDYSKYVQKQKQVIEKLEYENQQLNNQVGNQQVQQYNKQRQIYLLEQINNYQQYNKNELQDFFQQFFDFCYQIEIVPDQSLVVQLNSIKQKFRDMQNAIDQFQNKQQQHTALEMKQKEQKQLILYDQSQIQEFDRWIRDQLNSDV